jgi:nucleoprotein TPR
MLQEMNSMQSRDLENLQRRNSELHDQNTRLDIQLNQVSENLLFATSQNDQLRNEMVNLRAEKKIWEVSVCFLFDQRCTHHRIL